MKSGYYLRQNHKRAIMYLKSSLYGFRREKALIYIVISFSILFCVLGLIFSMLPQLVKEPSAEFVAMCKNSVRYIGFASGIFLVVQIFIKIISTRLHIEAVNSIERFDNYVYDLNPNRMIMRPMTEAQLENNATRIKSNDICYNNCYFQHDTDDDVITIYNNQREIFINEYHLMMYVKSKFFNYLWIGFAIFIFFFAIIVNDGFFNTLLNIFFPSISIISLIVSSILSYNLCMKFLQNTLTQFETAEKDPLFDKRSELVLRQNQDSLFQYRMNSFNIPMFLIRKYDKSSAKRARSALSEEMSIPKTSPFISVEIRAKKPKKNTTQSSKVKQDVNVRNAEKEVATTIKQKPSIKKEVKRDKDKADKEKVNKVKPKANEPEKKNKKADNNTNKK